LDGDGEFLSFSEFVSVVSTFCLFGPEEIIRFAFNCVDEDKSGFVSLEELDNLAGWLHDGGPSNLNTAIACIRVRVVRHSRGWVCERRGDYYCHVRSHVACAPVPQDKYDQGDGQIAFEHFKQINREFPFILHPAFHLQEEMQRAVLGQTW